MRFRKDHPVSEENVRVRPDVVFPRERVAVFTDGCFWHGCPIHFIPPRANADFWSAKIARNKERDRVVDSALRRAGWLVLRFWEHASADEAAERVAEDVRGRRLGGPET